MTAIHVLVSAQASKGAARSKGTIQERANLAQEIWTCRRGGRCREVDVDRDEGRTKGVGSSRLLDKAAVCRGEEGE